MEEHQEEFRLTRAIVPLSRRGVGRGSDLGRVPGQASRCQGAGRLEGSIAERDVRGRSLACASASGVSLSALPTMTPLRNACNPGMQAGGRV